MGSRGREEGQALAELALVVTVLVLLVAGALDLGRAFYSQISITNAAKEGALVASQGGSLDAAKAAAVAETNGAFVQVKAADVTATKCPDKPTASTPPVTVTVATKFTSLTPIIAAALGGNPATLTSTATAQCRYIPPYALSTAPPPSCLVPNLVGTNRSGVDALWQASGFKGGITYVPATGSWMVVSQDPAAGTKVLCSSALTVSQFAACSTSMVPTVDGLDAPAAANSAITAAGLVPNAIGDLKTGAPGKAKDQTPAVGACVATGSTVTYHYKP